MIVARCAETSYAENRKETGFDFNAEICVPLFVAFNLTKGNKMNQSKLKYARERLEILMQSAIADVKKKFPYKREYNRTDAIDRIMSGETKPNWAPVREGSTDGSYSLKNAFIEMLDEVVAPDNEGVESKNEKIRKTIDAEVSKIKADRTAVEDELVLGDEEQAVKLLTEFNKRYA